MEGKIQGSVIAPLPDEQANTLRKLGIDNLEGPGAWKRFDDPSVPARPDYRVDHDFEEEPVRAPNESQPGEDGSVENDADGSATE